MNRNNSFLETSKKESLLKILRIYKREIKFNLESQNENVFLKQKLVLHFIEVPRWLQEWPGLTDQVPGQVFPKLLMTHYSARWTVPVVTSLYYDSRGPCGWHMKAGNEGAGGLIPRACSQQVLGFAVLFTHQPLSWLLDAALSGRRTHLPKHHSNF